jgi:hypothetical protein
MPPALTSAPASLAAFACRSPQIVRIRVNSPAFAFITMPWKYPPGLVRKCSAGLAETSATATAAHSRPVSGINDVAPDWPGDGQVGPQPRRQDQQFVNGQAHQRAAVAVCRRRLDGCVAALVTPWCGSPALSGSAAASPGPGIQSW